MASGETWSDDEVLITVYLYRFGWEDLGVTYADIASLMKRKPSALMYRFSNFLSFDGVETGLQNGGKHAETVYNQYKNLPKDELRRRAIRALLDLSKQDTAGALHP